MPATRSAICAALLTVLGLTAGCGDDGRSTSTSPSSAQNPPTTEPAASRSSAPPSGTAASSDQGEQMRIQIAIGDQRFTATIFDSAAGRDLIAQLPLSIDMTDHGSVEKTGPLPAPLSLAGQPDGADPDVGDVGYYAPGNDLVLYHGDQSYYPGIVVLVRLDGDAASRIAGMDGAITANVAASAGRTEAARPVRPSRQHRLDRAPAVPPRLTRRTIRVASESFLRSPGRR
ncbi:cyclophilin-like fold protein [Actinoplanes sp. NPDC049599]|uniref:cyclophilin-like fold protein n=1 Tax=Actinoplanes sp. NPDC049599 TaxID=3363903 RepID=UPI0037BCE78C